MYSNSIEIIAIGDELLMGQSLDSNSHWLADNLTKLGFSVKQIVVVSDELKCIKEAVSNSMQRSKIVLLTGGLGPTPDDITKPALAELFDDQLYFDANTAEDIRKKFAHRGEIPTENQLSLAFFPKKAQILYNSLGTAPGIYYNENGNHLFSMPGVPYEMKEMFSHEVVPIINKLRESFTKYHIFKTVGVGESHLLKMLGNIEDYAPVKIAFLPNIDQGVTLRLTLSGDSEVNLNSQIEKIAERVRKIVKAYIYSEDEHSLEEVIVQKCKEKSLKVSFAESCTGGLIASRLVSVAGSSSVFDMGFIVYSNEAKSANISVDPQILSTFKAVSEESAIAMAKGCLQKSNADIAISVTGIAGPDGGSEMKPIGLTYIGLATKSTNHVEKFVFTGNRNVNRRRAATAALNTLLKEIDRLKNDT